MKTTNYIFSFKLMIVSVLILGLTSCNVSKTGSAKEYAALTDKIQNGTIRIAVDAAYPSNTAATQRVLNSVLQGSGDSANRIDLTGDGHFMELNPQKVSADLPFYGEQRQGGGYNSRDNAGVKFEVAPDDYIVRSKENSYSYDISFNANDPGNDNFDTEVILYANGNVMIYITSNRRSRIEYRGRIVESME
ncbi:DUF4251 domain-containing protein [Nonlabens antarcticus]|uniref:DUF4251 domain-containing protein n=1 Tax=Nonlabens antarcticus TaxID=392714 RepID=UPI001890BC59|nr:DUF4251 domain-containing protein [Nonlabens antarcticus]